MLLLDDAFLCRLPPGSLATFLRTRLMSRAESELGQPFRLFGRDARLEGNPGPDAPLPAGTHAPLPVGSWAALRAVGVGLLAVVILLVSGTETAARLFRAGSQSRRISAWLMQVPGPDV